MIARLLFVLLMFAATAGAGQFTALVAFGDSLTDTWREPSADPVLHYDGRWSNGPLWVEFLSERLGFPYDRTNNYAHSGAQCNDAYQQVTNAVVIGNPAQTLYVIWAGGNDFLQEYDTLLLNDAAWDAQIHSSVSSLSNSVVSLLNRGAHYLLVPNTVDVSVTPGVNSYLLTIPFLGETLRTYFRGKVQQFNRELDVALRSLRSAHPAAAIYSCDAYAELTRIMQQPATFGFTEIFLDALTDTSLLNKAFDGPGARYVFWDPIHPTTRAHAIIADWFEAIVAPRAPTVSLARNGTATELRLANVHIGTTYSLEHSANLQSWTPLATVTAFPETSAVHSWTNTVPAPAEFYRASWTMP